MKNLSIILSLICLLACTDNKNAYQSGENKEDKNYHAKTANGIINKAQSNYKKHGKKADRKRRDDMKNASKGSSDTKKRVVKNPGPFNFY